MSFTHGNSGYRNYGCRCDICVTGQRIWSRNYYSKYRQRDHKICMVPGCTRKDSYSRGVCYRHYRMFHKLIGQGIRTWKEFEKYEYCLPVRQNKYSDEELRKLLRP